MNIYSTLFIWLVSFGMSGLWAADARVTWDMVYNAYQADLQGIRQRNAHRRETINEYFVALAGVTAHEAARIIPTISNPKCEKAFETMYQWYDNAMTQWFKYGVGKGDSNAQRIHIKSARSSKMSKAQFNQVIEAVKTIEHQAGQTLPNAARSILHRRYLQELQNVSAWANEQVLAGYVDQEMARAHAVLAIMRSMVDEHVRACTLVQLGALLSLTKPDQLQLHAPEIPQNWRDGVALRALNGNKQLATDLGVLILFGMHHSKP